MPVVQHQAFHDVAATVGRLSLDRFEIARALADAAAEINAPDSVEDTLDAIVHAAQRSLAGIDHVGVSLSHRGGRVETVAATDQIVRDLDELQYSLGEGPCLWAIEAGPTVTIEHAERETRWPAFMAKAVELGMRSQLGVRVFAESATLGGLNMYSASSATVDPDTVAHAELFARHAALALGKARLEEQLTTALSTRRIVGRAIGIVMERYRLTEERAFAFLAGASQNSNIKLRDIAQSLVAQAANDDRTSEERVPAQSAAAGAWSEGGQGPSATASSGEAPSAAAARCEDGGGDQVQ